MNTRMGVRAWFREVARDHDIEEGIRAELAYDPSVGQVRSVRIEVLHGVVTMGGVVCSLAQKWAVERAVRRVAGVSRVLDELVVDPPKSVFKSDDELADAVATVLAWTAGVPDGIRVSARDGRVTLDGTVGFRHERLAAADAVRRLVGVREVENRLVVATVDGEDDIVDAIRSAIHRRTDGRNIAVRYEEGTATLEGTVRAWPARASAEDAARLAPGVKAVVNRIVVER